MGAEFTAGLGRAFHVAQLRQPYRNLMLVIAETGIRAGDACALPSGALLADSAGWPYLRFDSAKMRAEQLVPLSAKAAYAVRAQQARVREHCPTGSRWLFPAPADPQRPVPYGTLYETFKRWQRRIGLEDEAGCAVTVTLHQFRHTFGTRLTNSGVPPHVIQRLLGHASPAMTAVYAHYTTPPSARSSNSIARPGST